MTEMGRFYRGLASSWDFAALDENARKRRIMGKAATGITFDIAAGSSFNQVESRDRNNLLILGVADVLDEGSAIAGRPL